MEIYVLRGIIVFLISFIVFRNITILPWEYLLVLDFIWGVLLYFFNRPCNYRFHRAVFAGVLGNWAAYLLNFLVNGHVDVTILWHQLLKLNFRNAPIILLMLLIVLFTEVMFAWKLMSQELVVDYAKNADTEQTGKENKQQGEMTSEWESTGEKQTKEESVDQKAATEENAETKDAVEKSKEEKENIPSIFEEHRYDIERIKSLLNQTRILGIQSSWGNGKSFVVDYFCNLSEIKEQYFIIKIEALAYQYDEFDKVLISKLDDLLRSQHIFSFYASEVLNTLGKNIWGRLVYHYFRGNETGNTSMFKGLKEEVGQLPKKVLIVFEDLERVNQEDAVKKILAISELLAGNSIRVIYEYDRQQFTGLSQRYLEKYIPVEMNLTEISFTRLVSYLWDELGMKSVNKKIVNSVETNRDLKSLINEMVISKTGFLLLGKARQTVNLDEIRFPIRRIKNFLIETKGALEKLSIERNPKLIGYDELEAKTVVAFFYVKYFLYKYYEKIEAGKDLDDCLSFDVHGEQVNIKYLYREYLRKKSETDLVEELDKDENKWVLTIYNLFSYCIDDYEVLRKKEESSKNPGKDSQLTVDELERMEEAQEKRSRCNHMVWNLLQNGRSEYSDAEACVNKFIKDVLNCPEEEWKTGWKKFCNDLYHEQIFKDNRTINLIGHDYLYDLAKAFSYQRRNNDTWVRLIHFVFFIWGNKPIDTELIDIMNTFKLESNDIIIEVLKAFNSLHSEGNFNPYREYWHFFDYYVGQLIAYGYLDRQFSWAMDYESESKKGHIKEIVDVLKQMAEDAEKKQKSLNSNTWEEDIFTIATFIQKNEEIIQMKEVAKEKKPGVTIKYMRESFPNQKAIDCILGKINGKSYSAEIEKQMNAEMERMYNKRQLYPLEICRIKMKMQDWKNEGKKLQGMKECKNIK